MSVNAHNDISLLLGPGAFLDIHYHKYATHNLFHCRLPTSSHVFVGAKTRALYPSFLLFIPCLLLRLFHSLTGGATVRMEVGLVVRSQSRLKTVHYFECRKHSNVKPRPRSAEEYANQVTMMTMAVITMPQTPNYIHATHLIAAQNLLQTDLGRGTC